MVEFKKLICAYAITTWEFMFMEIQSLSAMQTEPIQKAQRLFLYCTLVQSD